ncbi:MAG: NAD(P)H-dependent oxidoreductase subunit E [Inquilinaceae bacterium]
MPRDRNRTTRKPAGPKGRRLDESALAEIVDLLGSATPPRDRLIECLHAVQDRYGHLSARHLRALADHMRLSMAEIFEVATFYHHFDVVPEGARPPPPLTIRICDSISCMIAGAEDVLEAMGRLADPARIRVLRAPCMGRCAAAPAARVGDREVDHATADGLVDLAEAGQTDALRPAYADLEAYRQAGGYRVLDRIRAGAPSVDDAIAALSSAGLRGLGGAGFPLGRKWAIVRDRPAPRLMTINADEGEPGTFKDRHYLETDPHRMFEGALIAAHAVAAERIYLYLRDEYPAALAICRREIAALEVAGLAPPGFIELRRGAGAYICGEESAMLESIEGKRGLPRHRPPYIAERGLFGRPTLNHNVETLWWVRDILERGAPWFADQGRPGHPGPRTYSVSGRVRHPGVKLAPAGITARDLIEKHCGGMREGHVFKAYLPGGASGGLLPATMGDLPLDFGDHLFRHGAFVGSHAVVVLSDRDDMRAVVLNLMRFFRAESCGQCTPCRNGTAKMVGLLERESLDEDAIGDLEQVMRDASICGLGQAAPNPVRHLLTHFRDDLV